MIKDRDGYPVDHFEIEVNLRDRMVLHIPNSIIRNLGAIKKFLQIPGYKDICAGIYTYAMEEYGKILYLKSLSPSSTGSNKIKLHYKRRFLSHHANFPLAWKTTYCNDDLTLEDSNSRTMNSNYNYNSRNYTSNYDCSNSATNDSIVANNSYIAGSSIGTRSYNV